MKDQSKTNQELLEEISALKQKIQGLEHSESERKLADEALREREKRFRALAEFLPETVYETDIQGILTFVNRNAFDRFGYTQEDFEGGLNAMDVIIPDDRGRAMEHFQRIVNGENIGSIEYTVRRKDGSTFPAMIHTSVIIHDGKPFDFRGFIVDITEQKRAEERLTRINTCLLSLGPDFDENVARLTALCGELLGATCALYNRLESGMLCSTGQWHTPPDYATEDKPDGHICYDVIRQGSDETLVVRNLSQTHYAATDPNVTKYGLRTYIGQVVRCAGEPVGSLCVVFQRDLEPTDDHKRILGIIASSLTSEENRRQVEESLRKNRRQLTDIIDFLPDATFAIDKERRVIIWNKAIEKMTGVPAAEMIGQGDYAYTIPFYGEARPQLMDLVFEHQEEIAARYPSITREGDTLITEVFCNALDDNKGAWVFAKASPLHDQAGNIIGAIESIRDITESRQAEKALIESEKKYRNILENIEDGYYEVDIAGNLTFFNNSVCRILGYSADELMHKNNREFTDDENAKNIFKIYNEVYRTGISIRSFDWELIRKDGSKCFVETDVSLITDSNNIKTGFRGIARDITDRKRAEDALRESEKKYRLVLEANPDPMIVYDVEGKVIYLNPAFTSVFGWSLEERIGKKMDDFVPEESWLETRMMIDMVIAGKNFSGIETRRLTREGKMIPISVSGSCYRNQEGNIEASVINLRDITESKRVEAEKKQMEEQYRQAQKMEAIGQLAGGIAHDFNNMLNIILGYSQLALMKIEPSGPLYTNIQEIINAVQRSADLVRQLLVFARKQTIALKVLDLNDTVAGTLNMLRKLIGENIDLIWIPAANLWPVKMDPTQIDQILANLAVNARDSISGVGKIIIETGKAEFDEAYCETTVYFVPGQYVMLAVSDNGCGMDKGTREKIFEPFFTTKEIGKGTGMGLATVYGIVKQNNGFINVYSEPGKGTTFKIYLPRREKEGPAIDESGAHAKSLTGAETVLLVEDNEALLKMAKIMLEELGYTVLSAGSPNEALRLAEEHAGDIHLLVTDVVMPEMSGRDLQKRLSALKPDMKYLFMSGYTANVIAHRGILDEGVHFLQKPFHMEDMAARVREALEK